MNDAMQLQGSNIKEIQQQALMKLVECKKQYDVIGEQIFSILGRYARVIYYPLGSDGPWGFTHMRGKKACEDPSKPFVAINTAIPLECQVFAAAHELYHIWFNDKSFIVSKPRFDESVEASANRFAAEFLVQSELLKQEMQLLSINENHISIKEILRLAYHFVVPYRMMVKRLYEIAVIDADQQEKFLRVSEDEIAVLRKRYSLNSTSPDDRVAMDNLVELAVAAYEVKYITYEKLQYLLRLCKLTPADVGIEPPLACNVPSDEELDAIMED